VKGLTINNTAGVNLAGPLDITDVITISGGTFASGGHLTLKSTATATARVARITSVHAQPITGKVNVERYVPGRRKYRLITSSVTTSTSPVLTVGQESLSIWANWQNGGSNAEGNTGTFITGGSSAGGFDTQTPNASLFTYDDVNRKYVGFSTATGKNTKYTPLKAGIAYYMFVYGDRVNSVTSSNPNNTVLKELGTLLTGDQVYTTSSSIPLTNVAGRYTMLGNPFASPIDWVSLPKTNLSNTYWGWDPNLGSTGGYVTVSTLGDIVISAPYSGNTGINQYIQPGQGFFVKTISPSPTLTIREQDKAADFNPNAFRIESEMPLLAINLIYTNGANKILADGVVAAFNNEFSDGVGTEDASKMINTNEGLAILNGAELLSIDARKTPKDNDTLYLNISKITKPEYTLQIFAKHMGSTGLQAFLHDKFLNTVQPISLTDTNRINFTANPIQTGTTEPGRFRRKI
jgi:hypothetical protein